VKPYVIESDRQVVSKGYDGNPIQNWHGVIDDVRIDNRALSDTEVAGLQQCPGTAAVRVIQWREVRK